MFHSSEKVAEADLAAKNQLEPRDPPDAQVNAVRHGEHPFLGQEPQEEIRHRPVQPVDLFNQLNHSLV